MKYYPFGGLEKSFLNICKEAIRRGHSLTIYCKQWQGDKLAGANIIELPVKGLSNHRKMQSLHHLLMLEYRRGDFDVLVGFKRLPDLDVYYNGDVCFIQEAAGKHGGWYKLTARYRSMARMEAAVFAPESKTHILYIAEREKAIYQGAYHTPENRFHALPAGIDKAAIREAINAGKRDVIRAEQQLGDERLVILMVGSDFKRKGLDRAIDALAALPPLQRDKVCLWIVGTGDAQAYQKQAARLGVDQQLVFWGGRNDVPNLLSAADILLHPARVETAGNAIIEGMVAGLAVIVSASAGFSSHVAAGEGGLLVEDTPYQQQNLNQALERLVSDAELRKKLGANGWHYADNTDLYRRPQVAMDVIETVART